MTSGLITTPRPRRPMEPMTTNPGKAANSVSSHVDTNSQQVRPEHHLGGSTPVFTRRLNGFAYRPSAGRVLSHY